MRFGFKTSPQDTTWGAKLEVWRAADAIDVFESGWTSDHFYPLHGAEPSCPRLEGWVTLAALAQATRRTFPPCWSRWPVRCPRCEAAERRAGAEIRGGGH